MKILYADTGLRGLEGHHASSAMAVSGALRDLGHEVTVLGYRGVADALRQSTGALPFFEFFTYDARWAFDPLAGWLTDFWLALELTAADLGRAWRSLGPFDLIYLNSVKPAQMAALGPWLRSAFDRPEYAPPIIVEFGTEPGLVRTGCGAPAFEVRDRNAVLYRQATRHIGEQWIDRIAFIAAAAAAAEEYSFLIDRPVGVTPMPQSLPPLRRRQPAERLTIGLLGHQRLDKGYQLAPEFIPQVLARHGQVRFLVHQSDAAAMTDITARLSALAADEPRLELKLEPTVADAWFALIDRCDIVALPYDPQRYAGSYSAIVGEALASGAPVVVPAATTMATEVATAGGPGVTIDAWNAPSIAAAIGAAIDDFTGLADRAWRAGQAWHERHGSGRFAACVLEAANRLGPARRWPPRFLRRLLRGRR
jgi:hypothetical protein